MKRFCSCLVLLIAVLTAWGQDIIVTTHAKRINARIVEITEQEVVYRSYPDTEGAIEHIALGNIVSILFEDGRVSVFKNDLTDPSLYDRVARQPLLPGLITKQDKYYCLNEDDQVTRMSEEAYLRFIENNCPEAWQSYQRGDHLYRVGWRFFGSGLTLVAVGIPISVAGIKMQNRAQAEDPKSYYGFGMEVAGIIMMAGGTGCTIASIPLLTVGAKKKHHTHEVYNDCYQLQHTVNTLSSAETVPALSLNLQATPHGIGIALQF